MKLSLLLLPLFPLIMIASDFRAYQHGIDFLKKKDGSYYLIWASTGDSPTGADKQGNWTHDIYYETIDPHNIHTIKPTCIISRDEAQEPVTSAICADGTIMITMEDGWNIKKTVSQRYGLYKADFSPLKPYPQMVLDGGHSGHVTSVKNRFVLFYSDEWVNGGGVEGLGSGDDVLLSVYSAKGVLETKAAVSVGKQTRDWWPMVAGSQKNALLLWQRFMDNKTYANLMFSLYNPSTQSFTKIPTMLETRIKYYTYDVQYIKSINRFLVAGTYKKGGGFAYLIDDKGKVTAENLSLPSFVREAQPAIYHDKNLTQVVYPKQPSGLQLLELTASKITLKKEIKDNYQWSYIGTDGIFIDKESLYFVTLSKKGLVEKKFSLK